MSSRAIPVPRFHPTEAEFADFNAYVATIEPLCQEAGLGLVVPPASWLARVAAANAGTAGACGGGGGGEGGGAAVCELDVVTSAGRVGDMRVRSPVQQCLGGAKGIYKVDLQEKKDMSVAEFREHAYAYERRNRPVSGRHRDGDGEGVPASSMPTSSSASSASSSASSSESSSSSTPPTPPTAAPTEYAPADDDAIERTFWRSLSPYMEAPTYGADVSGSLFPDETTTAAADAGGAVGEVGAAGEGGEVGEGGVVGVVGVGGAGESGGKSKVNGSEDGAPIGGEGGEDGEDGEGEKGVKGGEVNMNDSKDEAPIDPSHLPWNLSHLDTLLSRGLRDSPLIPGITQSMLYFGMWKVRHRIEEEE